MAEVVHIPFIELDGYIGEPVWDCDRNRWRVLIGYRRYEDKREVMFTDSKGMEDWESVDLTKCKITDPKLDVDAIKEGLKKKDFKEHCFG